MVKHGKLHPIAFGFAWGLISGIGWMLLCWSGARWGFGLPVIKQMSNVYYHLSATFAGGLWGFFWGFIDLFVFGMFVAFVYNYACCYFCSSDGCDNTSCK